MPSISVLEEGSGDGGVTNDRPQVTGSSPVLRNIFFIFFSFFCFLFFIFVGRVGDDGEVSGCVLGT